MWTRFTHASCPSAWFLPATVRRLVLASTATAPYSTASYSLEGRPELHVRLGHMAELQPTMWVLLWLVTVTPAPPYRCWKVVQEFRWRQLMNDFFFTRAQESSHTSHCKILYLCLDRAGFGHRSLLNLPSLPVWPSCWLTQGGLRMQAGWWVKFVCLSLVQLWYGCRHTAQIAKSSLEFFTVSNHRSFKPLIVSTTLQISHISETVSLQDCCQDMVTLFGWLMSCFKSAQWSPCCSQQFQMLAAPCSKPTRLVLFHKWFWIKLALRWVYQTPCRSISHTGLNAPPAGRWWAKRLRQSARS